MEQYRAAPIIFKGAHVNVRGMQAVILAGGSSSRFWPLNTRHKCLMRIAGYTLLEHTLYGLQDAGIDEVVIVQGPDRQIADAITAPDDMDVAFAVQPEPKGMGNALAQARDHINDQFLVTGPYRFDAGNLLARMQSVDGTYDAAVAGAETAHPERYGILDIDEENQQATGIVEKPDPGKAPSRFKVISTYLLTDTFFQHLDAVEEHEYQFEDALDRYMAEQDVAFTELEEEPPSLKYPWDLFGFAETLLDRQERRIADSADIRNNVTIEGQVVIEDDVTVYENAVIRGPCYIGESSTVGNNAVVRQYTNIEAHSTVGANAEIRGSIIQPGFSCHSGFIGDSLIGRNVSLGAGVTTANRMVRDSDGTRPDVDVYVRAKDETVKTGRNRLGVIAGDRVDIGTQANLMPGVCIGRRSFVGPSAFVRHNVGEQKRYFTQTDGTELERHD